MVIPFSECMKQLADDLYEDVKQKFRHDTTCLDIKKFNSCTVLLYYGKTLKRIIQLGFHRDQLYRSDGTINQKQNSQAVNTPTVVLTVGDSRMLHFILCGKEIKKNIHVDSFELDHGSMFFLHPCDEIPMLRAVFTEYADLYTYYKHGGVKHGPSDGLSVAFVFRTVNCFQQSLSNGGIQCNEKMISEAEKNA